MKMRFVLIIIFFSVVVGQLNAMLTRSFMGLPGGSYQQSCQNIKIKIEGEGLDLTRVITAECQDAKGKWKKTTIKVPVVGTQETLLENNNGQLKIVNQSSLELPLLYQDAYSLPTLQQPSR